MSNNPLTSDTSQKGRKITREMLEEYCDEVNRRDFVHFSGKPYFLVEKTIGGKKIMCMERVA